MTTYLNRVSNEAEDGTDPQKHSKSREQVFAKLHPFWRGFGWGERIRTILLQIGRGLRSCQTFREISGVALAQFIYFNDMDVQLKLLLEIVHTIFICKPRGKGQIPIFRGFFKERFQRQLMPVITYLRLSFSPLCL